MHEHAIPFEHRRRRGQAVFLVDGTFLRQRGNDHVADDCARRALEAQGSQRLAVGVGRGEPESVAPNGRRRPAQPRYVTFQAMFSVFAPGHWQTDGRGMSLAGRPTKLWPVRVGVCPCSALVSIRGRIIGGRRPAAARADHEQHQPPTETRRATWHAAAFLLRRLRAIDHRCGNRPSAGLGRHHCSRKRTDRPTTGKIDCMSNRFDCVTRAGVKPSQASTLLRNCRVRSFARASRTCSGGPSSMIRPSASTTHPIGGTAGETDLVRHQ